MLRPTVAYRGETEFRGVNDLLLGSNVAGLRSESRVFQPSYSSRQNNTNGQTLISSGLSYGDILERVRHTMHTTGSISDALGGSTPVSGGLGSAYFTGATGVGRRQSESLVGDSFNQTTVNSLASGMITGSGYSGIDTRFVAGNAGGNATTETVRSSSYGGEGINHPAAQLP